MGQVALHGFEQTGSMLPQPRKVTGVATSLMMALLASPTVATTTATMPSAPQDWVAIVSSPTMTGVWVGEAKAVATARDVLDEVKDTSGLTWEQIGRVMRVSRRSIHLWLKGSAISAANEERLHRVLYIFRLLAGRSQLDVRSRLLDKTDGTSVVELLSAGKDAEAEMLALTRGAGTVAPKIFETDSTRSKVSDARRSSMTALDLLETGSGPVKTTGGKAKRSRPTKRGTADAE